MPLTHSVANDTAAARTTRREMSTHIRNKQASAKRKRQGARSEASKRNE
jgi:hypothetical protein